MFLVLRPNLSFTMIVPILLILSAVAAMPGLLSAILSNQKIPFPGFKTNCEQLPKSGGGGVTMVIFDDPFVVIILRMYCYRIYKYFLCREFKEDL